MGWNFYKHTYFINNEDTNMIELATADDLGKIWTKLQEVMDRTKRHTKQIKELQNEKKDIS